MLSKVSLPPPHVLISGALFILALTTICCGCQNSAPAPAPPTYQVGDRVMVIKDATLRYKGAVEDKVFVGLFLKVVEVKGIWLSMGLDVPGWVDQANVIPASAAPAYLKELLARDPQNLQARTAQAFLWCENQEWDLAINELNEIIVQNPTECSYWNMRGIAWQGKGNLDKAIADYTKAIEVNPKRHEPYRNRGDSWNELGEHDKALADYNEAIRIDPKFATAYYSRGSAWYCKKEYDKAIADCSWAIQLDPKYAMAYSNRALVMLSAGRWQEALADAEEGCKLAPKDPWPLTALAWVLTTAGDEKYRDGQRARQLATEAEELDKSKIYFRYPRSLAAAHAELGQFDEAVKHQQEALRRATHDRDRKESQAILELYQQGKPYRIAVPAAKP